MDRGGAFILGASRKVGFDGGAELKIISFGHAGLPNRSITMGPFGFIRVTDFSVFAESENKLEASRDKQDSDQCEKPQYV